MVARRVLPVISWEHFLCVEIFADFPPHPSIDSKNDAITAKTMLVQDPIVKLTYGSKFLKYCTACWNSSYYMSSREGQFNCTWPQSTPLLPKNKKYRDKNESEKKETRKTRTVCLLCVNLAKACKCTQSRICFCHVLGISCVFKHMKPSLGRRQRGNVDKVFFFLVRLSLAFESLN